MGTEAQAFEQSKAERNLAASNDRRYGVFVYHGEPIIEPGDPECADCTWQMPSAELMEQVANNYATKPVARVYPLNVPFIRRGLCVQCGSRLQGFRDPKSMDEWKIAGTCQACQDRFYGTGPASLQKYRGKERDL